MRVLDVGSGAGDVAFLLTDMVGPAGEVVGVDRSERATAAAQARAAGKAAPGFVQTVDLLDFTAERPIRRDPRPLCADVQC